MHLEIDDRPYDIPAIGSLDMDENRVFYRATGMHSEDVWLGLQSGEMQFSDLLSTDGFLEAVAHIAYRREHENEADEKIAARIGKLNRLGLWASLIESVQVEEDDSGKGEGATKAPNESSSSLSSEKQSTKPSKEDFSGKPSTPSSEKQADGHATTGISASGSEPTPAHLRQVV